MKKTYIIISIIFLSSFSFSQTLKTPILSPFSKISQEIGLTEVSLEYSRPSAKGRIIFSKLVPFGEVWRTGANASTKITLSEEVKIGGKSIQPGTYALYTIPGKDIWTIIIHSNITLRSLAGNVYNSANDVFRFELKPLKIEQYVESFTIQFSDLKSNSFNLQLSWENTLINIPFEVEVDSKIDKQMETMLKNPDSITHQTYFEAAQYYLNNNKDLSVALLWINSALEKNTKNFRYGLLKAKIQFNSGDKKNALNTIDLANMWAKEVKNNNYIEQTELFRKSLLEMK